MEDLCNPFSGCGPPGGNEDLRQWWIAVLLIGSHIPAAFGTYFFYRVDLITEMVVLGGSAVVSIFYHTCQTTSACFHLGLQRWTFSDHFTAGFVPAMLIIATIRSHTLAEIGRYLRESWEHRGSPPITKPPLVVSRHSVIPLGTVVELTGEGRAWPGAFPDKYLEEAHLDARWTAGITYTYVIVVFLATVCHPYSMQAFIIVLAFGVCVILLKLVVIDQGDPKYLRQRISVPDLVVGIVLIAISIVYFILDSFLYYWLFHSLWHVFSYTGVYFYACGITKGLPGHHSLFYELQAKIRRARQKRQRGNQ